MVDTRGFEVVLQASAAVIQKALRGAWKSAECPDVPGDEGRIPEYLDVPPGTGLGDHVVADGQVQIPQSGLDAALSPAVGGAEIRLGLQIQLEMEDPPLPSAGLLEMEAQLSALAPIDTLPGTLDVGLLLDGLPRGNVSATLTSGHPLDVRLESLIDEFVHLAYENGAETPPVDPHIPHTDTRNDVTIGVGGTEVARVDTFLEVFDDPLDAPHRIETTLPTSDSIEISLPIYLRIYDIFAAPGFAMEDPMGIETRLKIRGTFESDPTGVYRARFDTATVEADPLQPAGADVAGSTLEGDNYLANKASVPFLDLGLTLELEARATELAQSFGVFEIEVPTTGEIETAIEDLFHEELERRGSLALWTPSESDADFDTNDVTVHVIADALVIGMNAGAGADVTAISAFIPAGREFAIALDGDTVRAQIDQARADSGFAPGDLPKRMEADGEKVDLKSLTVDLVDGALRMRGDVTVVDAVLGSIDVDAKFRVDVGLHWEPNAALSSAGFQNLEHHIIGDPEVDPERSVLFWVIAVILAVITFGAAGVVLGIVIIIVALVVESIARSVGSNLLVDGVTGAIDGIQAWPPSLSRIGRVTAVFHDNTGPDPDGVLIAADGLALEGTMEVISSCEDTTVLAAQSGGPYSVSAGSQLLLAAANVHSDAAYEWRPGDGAAAIASATRLHTYANSGLYVAKHRLEIEQDGGATSRHFAMVEVRNVPPVVDAGPDIVVREGEVVTLVASFTDIEPDDSHESVWIFGDDQAPAEGTIVEPRDAPDGIGTSTAKHAWCDNGDYVVLVRVRDQNGGTGTDTLRVRVLNVPPIVDAGPDHFAYVCAPLTLVAHFEDPGWCDTHTATWDFGDCTGPMTAVVSEFHSPPAARGTATATHTYETCGTYHVVCRVEDDDGAAGEGTVVVQIVDVVNGWFESGFRPHPLGKVANAWSAFVRSGTVGDEPSRLAGRVPLALFECESCVVHSGQRSQRVEMEVGTSAGLSQSVGANPGWGYRVTARFATGPNVVARLGVDPAGSGDPSAASVLWSDPIESAEWQQHAVHVLATDDAEAITIHLEATSTGDPGGPMGLAWFEDVELLPRQPYCPEPREPDPPREQCVDFSDLDPGREVGDRFDKASFEFRSMSGHSLELVDWGVPSGVVKLHFDHAVLIVLPGPASWVGVDVSLNTRTRVVATAFDADGEIAATAGADGGTGNGAVLLELQGRRMTRLQVTSKGRETAIVRVCMRPDLDRARPARRNPKAEDKRPEPSGDRGHVDDRARWGRVSAGRAVKALESNRAALLQQYDPSGVGVVSTGGDHAIVVYLRPGSPTPPEPLRIEGVPVRFERP